MITKRKNNAIEIAKSSLRGGVEQLGNCSIENAVNNWTVINQEVILEEFTLAVNATREIDFSPYLPLDNNNYEINIGVMGWSPTSAYKNIYLQFKRSNEDDSQYTIMSYCTAQVNASHGISYTNHLTIPLYKERKIVLKNVGNATGWVSKVTLQCYRRIK